MNSFSHNLNLSDDELLARVQNNGLYLAHIPDERQTKALCLAAIKNEPLALRFVTKQTRNLCLSAVRRNPWALDFVHEQTEEICLAAIQRNPIMLMYVHE